jgi:hypothetical protein
MGRHEETMKKKQLYYQTEQLAQKNLDTILFEIKFPSLFLHIFRSPSNLFTHTKREITNETASAYVHRS